MTKEFVLPKELNEVDPSQIPDENYQDLAEAIILRAVDDYRILRFMRRKKKEDYAYRHSFPSFEEWQEDPTPMRKGERYIDGELIKIESFFEGDWFTVLTKVDGKDLLRVLNEEEEREDRNCYMGKPYKRIKMPKKEGSKDELRRYF